MFITKFHIAINKWLYKPDRPLYLTIIAIINIATII